MFDQDTFIENYMTIFLATWAAKESRMHFGKQDQEWMKEQPVEDARRAARYAWYALLSDGIPQQRLGWRV